MVYERRRKAPPPIDLLTSSAPSRMMNHIRISWTSKMIEYHTDGVRLGEQVFVLEFSVQAMRNRKEA
eukprot:750480-Hanusia_phi.AAC.15